MRAKLAKSDEVDLIEVEMKDGTQGDLAEDVDTSPPLVRPSYNVLPLHVLMRCADAVFENARRSRSRISDEISSQYRRASPLQVSPFPTLVRSSLTRVRRSCKTGKVAATATEAEYRAIFDNFVNDLLSTLRMPEWPAAEILLSVCTRSMVSLSPRSSFAS